MDVARLSDASEWVQKLDGSSDQALTDAWLQWCRADPKNLPAFEQMQRLWEAFPAPDPAAARPTPATRGRHWTTSAALAAGVILLVALAGILALHNRQEQVLVTLVGEQRHVTLADGSELDLAPGSRVSTRLGLLHRDVLLERGQAYFSVAPSALRSFVVHTPVLTVTSSGTAFDVRIGPNRTFVTVTEGGVSVTSAPRETGTSTVLTSDTVRATNGQRVTFSAAAHLLTVAAVDPGIAESWRSGALQFVGEPLEDVVGEVNRYSAVRITLAPAFRQTRFTGTISPANVGDWLKALEQIYAVNIRDQGSGGILIQSRSAGGAGK
jgi:transmembrane sensor